MTCSEFDLIRRFFSEQTTQRTDVPLSIGDDAALLSPPPDKLLAVSVDTLIAGVHFPLDTAAYAVGHKALAVNLSDLAAMGAEPAWITLALSLPDASEAWLTEFSRGFYHLANEHGVQLVGGDTTRGPLSITVQAMGFVPAGQALTRGGAQPGDGIFVTGTIGDAGVGLRRKQAQKKTMSDHEATLIERLEFPTARISTGVTLRNKATSAIDISDGLAADLGHVLSASNVGADVFIDQIPLSDAFQSAATAEDWAFAVTAGDDYELCFTLPAGMEPRSITGLDCPCTRIGEISAEPGLRWKNVDGQVVELHNSGFDHFTKGNVQ